MNHLSTLETKLGQEGPRLGYCNAVSTIFFPQCNMNLLNIPKQNLKCACALQWLYTWLQLLHWQWNILWQSSFVFCCATETETCKVLFIALCLKEKVKLRFTLFPMIDWLIECLVSPHLINITRHPFPHTRRTCKRWPSSLPWCSLSLSQWLISWLTECLVSPHLSSLGKQH